MNKFISYSSILIFYVHILVIVTIWANSLVILTEAAASSSDRNSSNLNSLKLNSHSHTNTVVPCSDRKISHSQNEQLKTRDSESNGLRNQAGISKSISKFGDGRLETMPDSSKSSLKLNVESGFRESLPLALPLLRRDESKVTKAVTTTATTIDSDYAADFLQDGEQEKNVHNLTKTLNKILADYDKRIRPQFYGQAVPVGVTIMVKSLASISEVDMEFKIDFYLRQFWLDPRLQFELKPKVREITLSHEFTHEIWQPDTFFPNEKKSYIHSATVVNQFIRLNSSGQILKSTRLTLTATCPMSLKLFPMDHQICTMEIGSYGFSKEEIVYLWNDGGDSVKMGLNSVTLPQFQVLGHRQKKAWSVTTTGNYSMLKVDFLFVRSLNYYLTQIYVPAALIVIISWFALYMGREAAAERMALGVTTVLTITTLLLSTNSNSPKISYVKAMDIYLGSCFAYVFASLMQSAFIGYLAKKIKEQEMSLETAKRKMAFKKNLAKQEKLRKRQQQLMSLQSQSQNQSQVQSRKQSLVQVVSRAQSHQSLNGNFNSNSNTNCHQRVIPSISLQDIDDNYVELQQGRQEAQGPENQGQGLGRTSLRGSRCALSDVDDLEKNSVTSMVGINMKISSTKGNTSDTSSVGTDDDVDLDDDDATIIYPLKKDGVSAHDDITRNRMRMAWCDILSRFLFPIGFLLFNIVYWVYYLNVSRLENIESWKSSD